MKHFLVLLLGCLAGVAAADELNPCGASTSAIKALYSDLLSNKAGFQCAPAPIGNGTLPTFRSNTAGTVAWWYCPNAGGNWHVNWAAGTAASLSASNIVAEAYGVVTAADPKAAFHAAVAKKVNLPLSDPSLTPVWCPFVPQMVSGAPTAVVTASSAVVLKSDPTLKADAGR
jgi:hypothetical protein